MAGAKRDREVGSDMPPGQSRLEKNRPGKTRGALPKDLMALLIAALNEPVVDSADGHSRQLTKREAVIAHLVDRSAKADLQATKMLFDMMKNAEGRIAPPPKKRPHSAADKEVIANLIARLRRAELAKVADDGTEKTD
jgi:hypothetical protein